jgi:hypothetical protein
VAQGRPTRTHKEYDEILFDEKLIDKNPRVWIKKNWTRKLKLVVF